MSFTLPKLALSIRQPWAWAVIYAGKPVENRSWRKRNPGLKFRGECCVHASKGMTRAEYEEAADFMATLGVACPAPADLQRGGIIGVTTIADIVTDLDSDWFFGPKGLLLKDTRPVDFIPAVGSLGFFEWKPAAAAAIDPEPKWIKPQEPKAASVNSTQLQLFGSLDD
ncbi:hypothetical protein [Agrobacterium tumefaciens]|uniref:hypothetical protein n=1 Tax=Agrobacterium tumefaciens TaxID=358 RepID=UPI0021D18C68|nr:hypothetical protein [Agrobacterium tumefaciens]